MDRIRSSWADQHLFGRLHRMESKAHSTSITGYAWAGVGGTLESASKLP